MSQSLGCVDGRTFVFDPRSTALLSIDFQRDFLDPNGGCVVNGTDRLRAAVPHAVSAVALARSNGIEVIHTRESYSPDMSDVTELKRTMGYVGVEGPLGRSLIRGEPGCEIIEALAPKDGELVVDKAGFSAFYETTLEDHLRRRGVTHLFVAGVTYQCCVHSTLRDAVERGFFSCTLDDACAALEEGIDDAVRRVIRAEGNLFGWIATTASLEVSLEAAS